MPTSAMPILTVHPNAESFLAATESALARDELGNNLILGVPMRIRDQESPDEPENVYISVQEESRQESHLLGAAAMTPPYNLVIHVEEDAFAQRHEVFALLSEALQQRGITIPGVIGRTPQVADFATHWAGVAGVASRQTMSERVFKLSEVMPPRGAPGHLRRATMEDLPVAVRFFKDFLHEAMSDDPDTDAEERTASAIASGRLHFWVVEGDNDGSEIIVSMVGASRALPTGRTIGPVYTPPEERGKGYASNATAALSQQLLDEGFAYCTLFTDLSNPTSNHIYQQIGYTPVCDYAMYSFDAR